MDAPRNTSISEWLRLGSDLGAWHGRAMPSLVASQESVILGRVLRPERGDLPRETAEWLLAVDLDPSDHTRLTALYEKAQEGTLTEAEDAELEDYGDVGRLLEMLKAKASASLRKADAA